MLGQDVAGLVREDGPELELVEERDEARVDDHHRLAGADRRRVRDRPLRQVEVVRLGHVQSGQDTLEAAVQLQQPLDHRAAAHRLAGDADRLALRPAQHVRGVRPDRVQVDERERRLHLREDRLEALVGLHWARHRDRSGRVDRGEGTRLLLDGGCIGR